MKIKIKDIIEKYCLSIDNFKDQEFKYKNIKIYFSYQISIDFVDSFRKLIDFFYKSIENNGVSKFMNDLFLTFEILDTKNIHEINTSIFFLNLIAVFDRVRLIYGNFNVDHFLKIIEEIKKNVDLLITNVVEKHNNSFCICINENGDILTYNLSIFDPSKLKENKLLPIVNIDRVKNQKGKNEILIYLFNSKYLYLASKPIY